MKNLKYIFPFLWLIFSSTTLLAQQEIDTIALQREARKLVREGNKLYNKQQFKEASIAYRKALNKNPKYDKAAYNLGNAFYQDKNYKNAVAQYELTTKTASEKLIKAEAYHNIGNAMMEQKQYDKAVASYKNSLRINPKDDETRYNLAVAQKLLKKQQQKNKDKKKNKKNNKNKDKKKDDKKKDNKKDKNKKDKGKDKDKKKDDKDKNKDKKKDDKGKDKKDPNKNDQKDQKQKPKPQPGKMTPQQMKQLLESLNNEEKKTQKKMNVKKAKGRKIKQEKDW